MRSFADHLDKIRERVRVPTRQGGFVAIPREDMEWLLEWVEFLISEQGRLLNFIEQKIKSGQFKTGPYKPRSQKYETTRLRATGQKR